MCSYISVLRMRTILFDVTQLRGSIINQEWTGVYRVGDLFTCQDMINIIRELWSTSPLRCLVTDTLVTFYVVDRPSSLPNRPNAHSEAPTAPAVPGFSLRAVNRDGSMFT